MAFQKKYKTLTKHTLKLLGAGESDVVDFKLKPVGLHVDDLVAFANTQHGGEIIIGVAEKKNDDGSQFGEAFGCDLGDDVALQILNKAVSAIPPIAVKLIAENIADKPIIRVLIASSENKPHCTPKGVYTRRDGSRNRPLHPTELLTIFLEAESRAFAERFEESAEAISERLLLLEDSLSSSVDNMASQLGWVDSQLDDTESAMQRASTYSKMAHEEAQDLSLRLRTLFRQDGRADPVFQKVRKEYLDRTIEQLRDNPKLVKAIKSKSKSIQMSAKGTAALELSKDDLQAILIEAFEIISSEKDDKTNEE